MNRSDAESRHKLLVGRFKKATFHKFQQDGDAWTIMKQLLPDIERGAMLDFGKEFGDIRARKRRSEELYRKKKSALGKLFRFLMFWKSN
ncbi:hypothetical protein FA13DRAFT_1743836 [Coprinellus micaceus]|uniref:Uncharacterized protein n=1 Tax=Coprinellus micaceus TaxID=71717 RepID=A0A4Y7SDN7_COPMI|nr:hypothetical protein FA13DRAFT_1743836 [Coprinellus micaceus]